MCEISKDILAKLKCSLCDGYLSCSPVITTTTGSSICGRCPVPTDTISVRNYAFEDLAKGILFPCTNTSNGCEKKFNFDGIRDHEKYCEYGYIGCPIESTGNCPWNGCRIELYQHCKTDHPTSFYENSKKLNHDIRKDNEKNMLLMVYGMMFLVQIKVCVVEGKIWHCVRYIGNALCTSQYKFTVTASKKMSNIHESKQVAPQGRLLIEHCCSIEININSLLTLFKNFDDIDFEIKVDRYLDRVLLDKFKCIHCGKYAKERIFKDINGCVCNGCQYDHDRDEVLIDISPQLVYPCSFTKKGCTYIDLMKNIEKHENYFCDYSQCLICCQHPAESKLKHYEKRHSSMIYKSKKFTRNKVPFETPDYSILKYNKIHFICGWGLENTSFIIFIYSDVPIDCLYMYSCEITLTNPKNGTKYDIKGNFKHDTSYDYMLHLDINDLEPYVNNNKLNISISIIKKEDI